MDDCQSESIVKIEKSLTLKLKSKKLDESFQSYSKKSENGHEDDE